MLKLAALAFLPIAAVTFGVLSLVLVAVPSLVHDFETAAPAYMTAAVASFVLAAPLAWLVARRMLTNRERRLLDARG